MLLTLMFLSQFAMAEDNGMRPMVVAPQGQPAVAPSAGDSVPSSGSVPVIVPGLAQPESGKPKKSQPMTNMQDLLKRMLGVNQEGEYFDGPTGVGGEYFGPGVMQKCDQVTPSAQKALEEAKAFRAACLMAQKGDQQRIAVNDHSVRPAMMYIFDLSGNCMGKTMVGFGNGGGGAQVACSDANSHMSPPGFHLTALHPGGSSGRYGPSNSMKMVGLQGQNSVGRGILIHGSRAPGTSSTWGCAGVGYEAYNAVRQTLGFGALVYNYFSPQQLAPGCRTNAGMNPNGANCRMDGGAQVPENATGSGAPAVSWFWAMIDQAHAAKIPAREKIKKTTEVSIYRYLKASDTYEITMVKEEAVGPNVATPEALKKALEMEGSLADFKKRMARDEGVSYVLKRDLPLLWEEEIFRRQQKLKKHK